MYKNIYVSEKEISFLLGKNEDNSEEFNNGDLRSARKNFEKEHIKRILEINKWNISKAAKHLGIGRAQLYNKIGKYNIKNKI